MHASASGTVKVRDTVFSNGCCIVKIGGVTHYPVWELHPKTSVSLNCHNMEMSYIKLSGDIDEFL